MRLLKRVIRKILREMRRLDEGLIPPEPPVFPRIDRVRPLLPTKGSPAYEPAGKESHERTRMLEAKVEYLLDELYRVKSLVRYLLPQSEVVRKLQQHQLQTFDWQWKNLPYHDELLINPAWRERAGEDVARRLGVSPDWFRGKKILDAGCGTGRHTWAFASLGARVTSFDMSNNGLQMAKQACGEFSTVVIEKRNILEPLPYDTDFDLVWSYGVVHHTGDPFRALSNICRHVRPGGYLYFMVYTEPRRDNIGEYAYYHEIASIREAIRQLDFTQKGKIVESLDGIQKAQQWFDAISSEVNELYTVEELTNLLRWLGFVDIKRTIPEEAMHNMVALKSA